MGVWGFFTGRLLVLYALWVAFIFVFLLNISLRFGGFFCLKAGFTTLPPLKGVGG
jgi:hypothetical protein